MRGLFFKIFAIFWLAQSLIFIISTALIVRQRFPSPNILSEALDDNLHHSAELAIRDFDAGGCTAFSNNTNRHEPNGATLFDQRGRRVCTTADAPLLSGSELRVPNRIDGREIDGRYVWIIPITSDSGPQYEYVWFQPPAKRREGHRNLLHFAFPQLPVAIAVGGLTTFVLVLLFSRPLVRLRKAARELAAGNLGARVSETPSNPLRSHSDEFQGLVHDFNHMAERLESLVDAQRLLLRDVSHELRSPLSRLSVALELARENAAPEMGQHLARIEREGERLNQLISQLLTLSSLEARDSTATFRQVSLNELCEQILPDAEYEAQRRPCSVVLEQKSECSICGDHELLYRAVENVVRNAIRYTAPNTQVTVLVEDAVSNDRRFATIKVCDYGPGIPDAELEHIFRPFYRLDHARSSSTGGFGVGLAISERATRLHNGVLRATNRNEGGTLVEFVFPMTSTIEAR